MPCQIATALGVSYVFQLNPLQVRVSMRADEGDWRSLRGGHYNMIIGPFPERIMMHVDCPAQRGSFPGTFRPGTTPDPALTAHLGGATPAVTSLVVDQWLDPQDYIHPLQNAITQAKGRVWINFPEVDIYNWYLCVSIDEIHQGGYGDVGLDLEFVLERRIELVRQSDQTTTSAPQTSADPPPTDATPQEGGATTVGGVDDGTPRSGQTYTMQSGDTLSSIAQRAYGDPSRWIDIYNANVALGTELELAPDPTLIKPGQVITIP